MNERQLHVGSGCFSFATAERAAANGKARTRRGRAEEGSSSARLPRGAEAALFIYLLLARS